jgi:hypothetical protein
MNQEIPNLPQSRLYLEVAKWGIESLLAKKPLGKEFRFHVVGIIASLRAVQHALLNHDSTISEQHRALISAWKKNTPMDGFEINFIRTSRNDILKAGSFESYATKSESGTGEGSNYTVSHEDYEVAYYKNKERRDLIADMQRAVAWCEKELNIISAQLPRLNAPD